MNKRYKSKTVQKKLLDQIFRDRAGKEYVGKDLVMGSTVSKDYMIVVHWKS